MSIRPFARLNLSLFAALLLALCLTVPAFADDVIGVASVGGGSLVMSAIDAPSVSGTLNGTDQLLSDTFDISVNDARGSGAGWSLQVTSTTFDNGSGKTLSNTASQITGVSVICAQGTCTSPTNGTSYSVVVPAAGTAPTAVKFFSAAVDSGLGDFSLTPTFRVSVPANTYAGTYNSTVTITIATGP